MTEGEEEGEGRGDEYLQMIISGHNRSDRRAGLLCSRTTPSHRFAI